MNKLVFDLPIKNRLVAVFFFLTAHPFKRRQGIDRAVLGLLIRPRPKP